MRFSNLLPAAAGFAGLASATLGKIPCVSDLVKGTDKVVKPVFDLAHHWEDDILFQGELCAATETSAAIDLDLRLIQAAVDGQVGIDVSAKFLQAPALRLSLAGVKAFVQLDLSASAAVYESVELFITPELSVDLLSILDLDLKALIALDLLVGVSAAVDVSAGVYVSFAEDAYIDIDLLKKDVLDVNLANPSIEALPIAIGADVDLSVAVELELGLRLRTFIALEADVEVIGIDLLEAGAEVAIYVNLFDYKTVLIDGSGSCAVSCSKDLALTLGLAVKLDVSILDLIDVSLTPNVFLTLATVGDAEICLPDRGTFPDGSHIGGGDKETDSPSGLPSAGLPSGLPSGPIPTPDGSEIVDGGDKESGLPSAGLPSAGLPSVGLPTGLTSGLPSGPVPTPDGSEIVDDGNTGSDSDETDGGSDSGSDGSDSGSDSGSDDSGSVSATITAAPSVHTPVHGGNGTMITSTEQVTATYTITKCEMDVVNCPANKKTVIVHSTVYYCPATKTKVPHLPEITKTSTMTPCPTPTKVTITDTPAKPTATPETPEHEKPKKPEGEKPKQPEQPEKPEGEKPEQPEQPEKPEGEKPEQPEQPEKPEEEKPEQSKPEQPEQPTPEQPESPVCPGSPECPEETMVHAPPPSAAIPTPPASTPTEPATAGAGSIKVGMASVFLGAAIAVML